MARRTRSKRRRTRRRGGARELCVSNQVSDDAIRNALEYLSEVPGIVHRIRDGGTHKIVTVGDAIGAIEDHPLALLMYGHGEWLMDNVRSNKEPKTIFSDRNTDRRFVIQHSHDNH